MTRIVQQSVQEGLMKGPQAGIEKFKELTAATKIFGFSLSQNLGFFIFIYH